MVCTQTSVPTGSPLRLKLIRYRPTHGQMKYLGKPALTICMNAEVYINSFTQAQIQNSSQLLGPRQCGVTVIHSKTERKDFEKWKIKIH